MSGYLPKQIILASLKVPASKVLEAVEAYLRHRHGLDETCERRHLVSLERQTRKYELSGPLGSTGEALDEALELEHGAFFVQTVRIGQCRYPIGLFIIPEGDDACSFIWKLGSDPIDAVYAYDSMLRKFDPEAKRGILELCLGVTEAAGAKGFLLAPDDDRLVALTAAELVEEIRVHRLVWSIAGVDSSLLSVRELQKSEGTRDPKRIFATATGLTIYDLMHPIK
jgi:hypothetical protein